MTWWSSIFLPSAVFWRAAPTASARSFDPASRIRRASSRVAVIVGVLLGGLFRSRVALESIPAPAGLLETLRPVRLAPVSRPARGFAPASAPAGAGLGRSRSAQRAGRTGLWLGVRGIVREPFDHSAQAGEGPLDASQDPRDPARPRTPAVLSGLPPARPRIAPQKKLPRRCTRAALPKIRSTFPRSRCLRIQQTPPASWA